MPNPCLVQKTESLSSQRALSDLSKDAETFTEGGSTAEMGRQPQPKTGPSLQPLRDGSHFTASAAPKSLRGKMEEWHSQPGDPEAEAGDGPARSCRAQQTPKAWGRPEGIRVMRSRKDPRQGTKAVQAPPTCLQAWERGSSSPPTQAPFSITRSGTEPDALRVRPGWSNPPQVLQDRQKLSRPHSLAQAPDFKKPGCRPRGMDFHLGAVGRSRRP